MKTKLLALLFMIGASTSIALSQCNCDYTIEDYNAVRNQFTPADFPGLAPGKVICLESGNWVSTVFRNIVGAPGNPIIIQNCEGSAHFAGQYTAIQFEHCEFIKLTGAGDPNIKYGIVIDSTTKSVGGIEITELSTDFEVEFIEVKSTHLGGAGIKAKTDPRCADVGTWRENFIMKNIFLHDNYIHDTGDEGMYIGYTGGYLTSKIFCGADTAFGHLIDSVHVYNNIIERTGRDGIQITLTIEGLDVHDNYISTYGNNGLFDQNFGLTIGSGSKGRIYNNIVIQTPQVHPTTWGDYNSRGISILSALPPTYVFNNIVVNNGGNGIWLHQRLKMTNLSQGYYVMNNTIVNVQGSGIWYNSNIPGASPPEFQENLDNGFYNNLIINPGSDYSGGGNWRTVDEEYIDFNVKEQRNKANKSHNYFTDSLETLLFRDTNIATLDLRIDSLSPARNYGMNLTSYGVTFDMAHRPRITAEDTLFDAGAFEWTSIPDTIIDGIIGESGPQDGFKVYPNPSEGKINVSINLERGGEANLRIVDFRGAKIAEETFRGLTPGDNKLTMDLDDINFKGAALLILLSSDKTRVTTIVLE